MRTARLLGLPAALAGIAAVAVSPAFADVQLEPQPCVITLAPQFTATPDGNIYTRSIPDSAIACPGFAFNSQTMSLNTYFQDANGATGPVLQVATTTTYDATRNAVVSTQGLEIVGSINNSATGVYTAVAPVYSNGAFYLTNPGDGKSYQLVLASPFQVTRTTSVPPACTLNLKAKYAYKWDQENYFVVPDSAVQCEGFTFTSQNSNLFMSFSSKVMGAGSIAPSSRRVFNRSTGTYSTVWELRLTSYGSGNQMLTELRRENGVSAPSGGRGWTWGRFTQDPQGATVDPAVNPNPLQSSPQYRLVLGKSFAIKRATNVTASGTRTTSGSLKVKIHADRNWSFQNTIAPTYRRQTVVPGTPADHAQLKRDGKLIRKVTLSPYGNATITVPAMGRHRYTVTMVETDENFAGSASFTK